MTYTLTVTIHTSLDNNDVERIAQDIENDINRWVNTSATVEIDS